MHNLDLVARPSWFPQVASDLQRHEGFREYAYPDPLSPLGRKYRSREYRWGYRPAADVLREIGEFSNANAGKPWTVGYGFTKGVTPFSQMKKNVADRKFDQIIFEHMAGLDDLVPNWRKEHPAYVITVLVNMIFNLGKSRLSQFETTLGLINAKKYKEAGINLRKSAWFKQVGDRAVELTDRLIKGEIAKQHRVGPDFSNVQSKVTSTEELK